MAAMTAVSIRKARTSDGPQIQQLLETARLPLEGALEAFASGVVAEDAGGRIVGGAALECFADGGLLRSVVVDASARGQGLGQRLTTAAIDEARRRGLPAIYLLTTTAADFFPRLGFVASSRDAVPASVQQSIEFRSACPASAAVLTLSLR
jgi:amino-acid N-acetyltransferase